MSKPSPPPASAPELPLTVRVERMVAGGSGFAHLPDGRALFVEGAFAGDLVSVTEVELARRHAHARAFSLIAPSAERRTSPCPHSMQCGGCDWIALNDAAQARHKLVLLGEALPRTAGLHDLGPLPPLTHAGSPLEYRDRVRLHIADDAALGFFAAGTHSHVPIERCAVCRPALNEALAVVRRLARAQPSLLTAFITLELRSSPADGSVNLHLEPRPDAPLAVEALEALRAQLPGSLSLSASGWTGSDERAHQRFPLPGGLELRLGPRSFSQVNWPINMRIIEALVEGALARGAESFCDLYCGGGNLTLPLLARGLEGVGVDQDARALRSARGAVRNLTETKTPESTPRAVFLRGSAAAVARRLGRDGRRFDLVVLDPPRQGAKQALGPLLGLEPRWIAYVSCDPATLARDLAGLLSAGCRLDSLQGFDMFPQTHHLETLVWLEGPTSHRSTR